MTIFEMIQKNILGALIGGAVAYFFPWIVGVGIHVYLVPSGITGAINTLLTVLLGAVIGAFIQSVFDKRKK
jgi:glycopeptide antibiotics resistance protein